MNIWEKLRRESGKSTYDISKELNIPEDIVKEIEKGDREVPTDKVDEVYNAFKNKGATEITSVERALMEKFFMDNDIQNLKKEFGYKTLEELSEAMHIGVSTMYYLRGQKIKAMSDNLLKKAYDFFQDGFNKKVSRKKIKTKYRTMNYMAKEDLPKEVLDWYYSTDIKALRLKRGFTARDVLNAMGVDWSYSTIYYEFEGKKNNKRKVGNWILVQQMYNYFNGLDLIEIYPDKKPEKFKVKENGRLITKDVDEIKTEISDVKVDDEKIEEPIYFEENINKEHDEEVEKETQMLDNDSPADDEETTNEEIETDEDFEIDENQEKITVSIDFVDDLISRVRRYEYLIDLLMEKDNR